MSKEVHCPECQALNPADYTFCHHCKTPRSARKSTTSTKKSAATKSAPKKRG